MQTLKIIAFPGAPNLPLFAAMQNNYFKDLGLDIHFTTTPSSIYQIQALHANEFDIAMTAFDNVVAYREGQGAAKLAGECDFVVIMGATQLELSAVVQNSVNLVEDLKGKSFALDAIGTGFAFVLYAMLDQLGLPFSEYERVAVGATPERWQSVKEGHHIGTMTIEPFTSIAKAAGCKVLRQSSEAFTAYQGGIVATKAAWLKAHPEVAKLFIKGYLQGLTWTLEPANQVAATELLLEKMPEIKPGVAQTVMQSLLSPRSGLTPKGAILKDGMQTVLALRSRYGKGECSLTEIEPYLDLSIYNEVVSS